MPAISDFTKPIYGLRSHSTPQNPKEVTLIVIAWEPDGKGEPALSKAELQSLFFGAVDSVAHWIKKASQGRYRLVPHPTHPVIGPFKSKYWWPFYWRDSTRDFYDPATGTWRLSFTDPVTGDLHINYVMDRLTAKEWEDNPYKVPPSVDSGRYYKHTDGKVYYLDKEGFLGGHTHSWAEAIREAAKVIDFKALDKDQNGILSVDEAVIVIVKAQRDPFGTQREEKDVTGSDVPHTDLTIDGVTIKTLCELYAGTPVETRDLAVAIEEVIHLALNYDDQYPDQKYRQAKDPGRPGQLSISDAADDPALPWEQRPVHVDAFHRLKWGWCNPLLVDKSRQYTLRDVETSGDVLIVPSLFEGRENEFFLVENRWRGTSYDRHRTISWGEGLAIWHCIHDASLTEKDSWARRVVHLRRADPTFDGDTLQSAQMALFDGSAPLKAYRLDDTSSPQNLRFKDGVRSGISMYAISPAGPIMTLYVHRTSAILISHYQAGWQQGHHKGFIKVFFDGGGYNEFGNLTYKTFRTMLDCLRKETPVYYDPNQKLLMTSHEPVGELEAV